jgi:hypothetical protein
MNPEVYLKELAKDPARLGNFMQNPERAMREAGVPEDQWLHVKGWVAKRTHDKLTAYPEAVTIAA